MSIVRSHGAMNFKHCIQFQDLYTSLGIEDSFQRSRQTAHYIKGYVHPLSLRLHLLSLDLVLLGALVFPSTTSAIGRIADPLGPERSDAVDGLAWHGMACCKMHAMLRTTSTAILL